MLSSINDQDVGSSATNEQEDVSEKKRRKSESRRKRQEAKSKKSSAKAVESKGKSEKKEESRKRKKRRKKDKDGRRGSDELAPLLSSYDLSYVIDHEDVEAQKVVLNSSESLSFVQSLQDFGKTLATDYFSRKPKVHHGKSSAYAEYYLESVATGRFKRILTKLDENGNLLYGAPEASEKDDYDPESLRQIMNVVDYLISSFFLVCEGILTGAALLESIIVFQVADERMFLQIYSPIALELRRLFYFLSVLSFVGACNKLEAEYENKKQWVSRGSRERSELFLYVFFYLLCLFISLISGPHADEMANTYVLRRDQGSGWLDELLLSPTLNLNTWRNLVVCRFLFSTIGWLLLCKDIHRDLYRGRMSRLRHED